jgi:hypothetical protein
VADLLSDTEIAKNNVQDVLDVDPAGEPSERAGGQPQFFGNEVIAFRLQGTAERLPCFT